MTMQETPRDEMPKMEEWLKEELSEITHPLFDDYIRRATSLGLILIPEHRKSHQLHGLDELTYCGKIDDEAMREYIERVNDLKLQISIRTQSIQKVLDAMNKVFNNVIEKRKELS
jgi:hypothetical protein